MSNPTIENNFTYHAPDLDKLTRHQTIRDSAKDLAYVFDRLCPDSRERSLAMTKLEEAVMWANTSIARHQEVDET